jgi:hypothetical protein
MKSFRSRNVQPAKDLFFAEAEMVRYKAQLLTNELVDTTDEHVLIDEIHPGEALVIAFGYADWHATPRFDFFGRLKKLEAAAGRPLNKILVRDTQNAWYHRRIPGLGDHVDDTVKSLRAIIRGIAPGRLITIGQSMGGYAAIMFGMLLRADRIISFGPLSFLNAEQALCYHDRRWLSVMQKLEADPPGSGYDDLPALCLKQRPAHSELHLHFGTRPDGEGARESVNLDAFHANRFAAYKRCHLHPYPFSGHTVVQSLIDHKQLDRLLARQILDLPLLQDRSSEIDAGWQSWITENLALGSMPEELVWILVQHGFPHELSREAVLAKTHGQEKSLT